MRKIKMLEKIVSSQIIPKSVLKAKVYRKLNIKNYPFEYFPPTDLNKFNEATTQAYRELKRKYKNLKLKDYI